MKLVIRRPSAGGGNTESTMKPEEVSKIAEPILKGVRELRDKTGQDASFVFTVPPDRKVPNYYRIIKRPMALNIIQERLRTQAYHSLHEFFVDMVQIVHNALTFNPPTSFICEHAKILDTYIRSKLDEVRQLHPDISPRDLSYPDLGPLPDHSQGNSDSFSSSEDAVGGKRRRRPIRKAVLLGRRKREEEEEQEKEAIDSRKKRGRPPTVDKPHEHRIKAIMRAVRRERDTAGRLLCTEFERVPDPRDVPTYRDVIPNPIALDVVKKRIKRRQYDTVEQFVSDMSRIFENAKKFMNDDKSGVHLDAVHLQQVLLRATEEELRKPDSAYADPESNSKTSRLPLDRIDHRGETYHVGDWVHLVNPNDPAKPTVGQIFRIWQENGQNWVNCCWYYRPEQTVHQHDKLFYENEVVKSGQYRDHLVDDILEKCFVMFITKYQRGRPKGVGTRSVYCCESRYNETEKTFNKIRTWKACIPDEIRSTDYPMDLFDRPKHVRRVVSPIKHLLAPDAKNTDPVPEPMMGASNAPPLIGAVYKRPYDPANPPEKPTPITPGPELVGSASPAAVPQKRSVPTSYASNVVPMATTSLPTDYAHAATAIESGASQSRIPTAYVLPEQYTEKIPEDNSGNLKRLKDGQLVWFPSCPVWIPQRILCEPLDPSVRFDVEGESKTGPRHPKGIGHSSKYLAWKLAKANQSS